MAAPTTPCSPWASVAFFQLAIDVVTALSNMSLPVAGYYDQTTVIGGTTASTIISALTTQRGLV